MEETNGKINNRLEAVMDEAKRIEADMVEEKAAKVKPKTITVNFNDAELDRLRAKADAACMKLQDYIRYILCTYA